MGAGSGSVATPTNVPQYRGGASSSNPYSQAANAQTAALSGTAAGMNYQPSMVNATNYNAATMAGPAQAATQMSAYQNPYENQVVQQTLRDVGQAQDIALNQMGAQATAANAFGGSRHGVAEAQTRLGYGDQAAKQVGQLRQQGFNTALGAAQFDVGQQTATQQANQAAINQARQFGAQSGMTAQQLNQMAGLQGAQQRLGVARQLGDLGRQSFGYGQSIQQQQERQGAMQRGVQQQLIDAAQGNLAQYTGAPTQGLNTLIGALTGAGVPSGQTTSSSPGIFNYLQVLAGMQD